jgi:hypothetical protein
MFRGVFTRGDGLTVPNNVTIFGVTSLLSLALRGSDTTLVAPAGNFYVGLCSAVPDPILTLAGIVEPTIGINGYARKVVTRDTIGWPAAGSVNGEPFLETDWLEWEAVGGPFDQPIRRLFITAEATEVVGELIALSAPLPADIIITPDTAQELRRFKYALFAGK